MYHRATASLWTIFSREHFWNSNILWIPTLHQHLQQATLEIWKDSCFRKYYLAAIERYSPDDVPEEPDSWRSRYFLLQDAETKRFEEAGLKLRSQHIEAVERKKEREVKITDRVPPPKRPRTGWNTTVPPKTLFQKTRSEASKLQKTIYNARVLPPMPTAKSYQVAPQMAGASSRVTVNTVIKRRPISAPLTLPALNVTSLSAQSSSCSATSPTTQPSTTSKPISISPPPAATLLTSEPPRIVKSPNKTTVKKDPMATLFVPKHKAYSQRPV